MSRVIEGCDTTADCPKQAGLSTAQNAALRYHGGLRLEPLQTGRSACPFLVVDPGAVPELKKLPGWAPVKGVRRPTDKSDDMLIYRRVGATPATARE